jgi:predicted nuclease with TOPRIM domain
MDGEGTAYKSPRHAQVWFLQRSRKCWKQKYVQLKEDQKRLLNRVNDVTKSREEWRDEAKDLSARATRLEEENANLKKELEDLKKKRVQRTG